MDASDDLPVRRTAIASQRIGISRAEIIRLRREDPNLSILSSDPVTGSTGNPLALPADDSGSDDDDEPATYSVVDKRKQYLEAYEKNAFTLIDLVINDDYNDKTLKHIEPSTLRSYVYHVLVSTSRPIIEALLAGNLPERAQDPQNYPDLVNDLKALRDASMDAAQGVGDPDDQAYKLVGIYGFWLVDRQGLSPTPNQLREIFEFARMYVEDDWKDLTQAQQDLIRGVDNLQTYTVSDTKLGNGFRKYLCNAQKKPVGTRVVEFLQLFKNAGDRLDQIPQDKQNVPLAEPFDEAGFTVNLEARIEQHETHVSSNALMNLIDAIAIVHLNAVYRFRPHVLYIIPEPFLASIAEVFFTRLAQSMVAGGGGVNGMQAGIQVKSAYDLDTEEWAVSRKTSKDLVDWRANDKYYLDHMQLQIDELKEEIYQRKWREIEYNYHKTELEDAEEEFDKALDWLPEESEYIDWVHKLYQRIPQPER